MARLEVAAGEGALQTWRTRSEPPSRKSSTRDPSRPDGLGAHARRAEDEVLRAEGGHEAAQVGEEGAFPPVAPHLRGPHPPVAPHEAQEARVRDRVSEVAPDHVAAPVALPGQRQDGVRAGQHLAIQTRG